MFHYYHVIVYANTLLRHYAFHAASFSYVINITPHMPPLILRHATATYDLRYCHYADSHDAAAAITECRFALMRHSVTALILLISYYAKSAFKIYLMALCGAGAIMR